MNSEVAFTHKCVKRAPPQTSTVVASSLKHDFGNGFLVRLRKQIRETLSVSTLVEFLIPYDSDDVSVADTATSKTGRLTEPGS